MELEEILKSDEYVKFERPDYKDAIIGISSNNKVIYDFDLMVEYLVENENMTPEEAIEYIDYNDSFGGYEKPIILNKIIKGDKLQNCYDMLREFYYEKNGLDSTIEFLEYIVDELEKIKNEQVRN